ncbi:MAG: hypothetical protein ACI9KE_002042 [Polyangiales bacterium]|jgi:hypothetical protein
MFDELAYSPAIRIKGAAAAQHLKRLYLSCDTFAEHEASGRGLDGPRPSKSHLLALHRLSGDADGALHPKPTPEGHSNLGHHASAERWVEYLGHQ